MKTSLFAAAAFACLIFAGTVVAEPDFVEKRASVCKRGQPCPEQCQQDRMHLRKHMKHKEIARMHRREAMRHRGIAHQQMRQFGDQHFGPMMPPEHRMGPRHFQQFRHDMPFAPEYFGPPMSPEHRKGPPPHMRFREGKHGSRAL